MICYTNHALDQFLELIVDVCKLKSGVVRVGGRSKCEKLSPFLLRNIKQTKKKERDIEPEIYYRLRDCYNEIDAIKYQLETKIKLIDECEFGILSIKYLKNYFSPQILKQFEYQIPAVVQTNDEITLLNLSFLKWLGFFEKLVNVDYKKIISNEKNQEIIDNDANDDDDFSDDEEYERILDEDEEIFEQIKKKKNTYKQVITNKSSDDYLGTYLNKLEETDLIIYESLLIQIEEANNDGWIKKSKSKKKSQLFKHILSFSKEKITSEPSNIWRLSMEERYRLYNHWLLKFKLDCQVNVDKLEGEFNKSSASLNEIRMQEDRSIMQNALIIAMTTTGSARYHQVLRDIGPRIVIVEEAAEVSLFKMIF